MTQSALYRGEVLHERLRPRRHRLRYRIFSLLLDLDELPQLHRRLRLLSVNARNVFSWREADHGDGAGGDLKQQAGRWLRAAGLPVGGRVRLLTMPRLFGYAFNPLNVYFCDAPAGGLQAIVYEVNSTFGERHHYLLPVLPNAARAGQPIVQACPKRMHVSPFIGMEAQYAFRVHPPGERDGERMRIAVDVLEAQGLLLATAHSATRHPLTDAGLLRALASAPLLTVKVIAAIHWEALRLFAKRVPLQPRPPAAADSLTIVPPPVQP